MSNHLPEIAAEQADSGGSQQLDEQTESRRSRALDHWDYRRQFGPFRISWGEGDIAPAFDAAQAYAIAAQELSLNEILQIWAHREVLVTFSSEDVVVGSGPAECEPAWVVLAAGLREATDSVSRNIAQAVEPGEGAVVQLLIHARTGEVLLGVAAPVALRQF